MLTYIYISLFVPPIFTCLLFETLILDIILGHCLLLMIVLQRNAVSTFNFLNEEGRLVAAALLPYGSEA